MSNYTKYTQIVPATDWFFVHRDGFRTHATRLAVWGIDESGRVIGLISVSDPSESPGIRTSAKLVSPPPITGEYKHLLELNQAERDALNDL